MNYEAISLISTAVGVLVALFQPYFKEKSENKKIIESIENELNTMR